MGIHLGNGVGGVSGVGAGGGTCIGFLISRARGVGLGCGDGEGLCDGLGPGAGRCEGDHHTAACVC